MWITIKSKDLVTFDPKSYFEKYDFWKETSYLYADMEYDDITDKLDTTNPEGKKYIVKIIKIKDHGTPICEESLEDKKKARYFFVAEEKYSEEEILKLRPYCRCLACKSSIFSLKYHFTCRCCVGCLYASDEKISHDVVKETRKYYRMKQLPWLTRWAISSSGLDID